MPVSIFLWIVAALIIGLIGFAYANLRRPLLDVRPVEFAMESVDAQPTVALAALLLEPPALNADRVARACERAWGGVFNGGEQNVRFVLGEPPVLMIRDGRYYYMFNSGDEPYLDNRESNLAQVADEALRRAAHDHRGWISMDFLEEAEQWPELRDVARSNIAKLFGELLPGLKPLAIVVPEDDRAMAWSESLGQRMRAGITSEKT